MHLRFTSTRDLLQKSCKIFLVGSGAVLFFNGSGFWRIKRIRHWNTGKLCQLGYEKKNNTSSQSEFKNNFSPMLPDYTFLCSDIYIYFLVFCRFEAVTPQTAAGGVLLISYPAPSSPFWRAGNGWRSGRGRWRGGRRRPHSSQTPTWSGLEKENITF